jgi:hypothetical protein
MPKRIGRKMPKQSDVVERPGKKMRTTVLNWTPMERPQTVMLSRKKKTPRSVVVTL